MTSDLRSRREALSLSQEELARRAGISSNTVSRIERNEQMPHAITLRAIEAALRLEERRQRKAGR